MRPPRPIATALVAVVVAWVALAGPAASPAGSAPTQEPEPGTIGVGPTARYVDEAHRLFLGRPATADEIRWWGVAVHRDARAEMTLALAASDEWAGARIDGLYRAVLDRPADTAGRAHWVRQIQRGLRLEDVAARFHGGEELWQRSGRHAGAYVDWLYREVLGREPDPGGRTHWVDRLRSGQTDRIALAASFLGSVESRRDRVRSRYAEVLGRSPDPAGLHHWTERLARLGDVVLAAHLAASPEFHRRATGTLPADVHVAAVGPGTAYPLQATWRPGCPVHHRDLVAVEFPHWDDSGARRRGVLVVHRSLAGEVAFVVRALFGTAFPLTGARPVDDFGGDDGRSMAADNSSAFNCRPVAGTSTWSEHAYGRAVDLNPERNPYVSGGTVDPPSGQEWLDRSHVRAGMIVEGGPVVRAHDHVGWGWGGRWHSARDHQHFSTTGR